MYLCAVHLIFMDRKSIKPSSVFMDVQAFALFEVNQELFLIENHAVMMLYCPAYYSNYF